MQQAIAQSHVERVDSKGMILFDGVDPSSRNGHYCSMRGEQLRLNLSRLYF